MEIKLMKSLITDIRKRISDRATATKEFDLSKISNKLNNKLLGLQRGKLYIVAGRVSNGKTAFMCDMAYNLIMGGKKVAFISLEMEHIDIAERILARALTIDHRQFHSKEGIQEMDEQRELLNKLYEDQFKNLAITQNIGFSFKELDEVVKKYLATYDVIIIDYLQMVRGSSTAKENMDEYLKHLRGLAIKQQKVIVLGSQINRAGASKEGKEMLPSMSDTKGTGCIEEVADVVLLCHWQYIYSKNEADKNKFKLIVDKNRATGETGHIELAFHPEFYRFKEV